jgi:hypothetical protein
MKSPIGPFLLQHGCHKSSKLTLPLMMISLISTICFPKRKGTFQNRRCVLYIFIELAWNAE